MPTASAQPGITAIVICRNAADHLDKCLRSLRWADELLVVNWRSTDNSLEIASRWADRIISQCDQTPYQSVQQMAVAQARHDWVLLAMPEDRLSQTLARDLRAMLPFQMTTAAIRISRQFYLRQKPLAAVPWGMNDQQRMTVLHRQRCTLTHHPHHWLKVHDGYTVDNNPPQITQTLRCDWLDSTRQLMGQWLTRMPMQALADYHAGCRFSLREVTITPAKQLLRALRHITHPRQSIWEAMDATFHAAAACIRLLHQLRRTPRLDQPITVKSDTAQRHAA